MNALSPIDALPAEQVTAEVDEMHALCSFDTIERYWSDPAFAAAIHAEEAEQRAINAAAWDRINAPWRAKQAARWAAEELAQGESA